MLQQVRTYLEMIRFRQSVFALPFAFMGAVLAAWMLNPPCFGLGPLAIPIVAGYSYT